MIPIKVYIHTIGYTLSYVIRLVSLCNTKMSRIQVFLFCPGNSSYSAMAPYLFKRQTSENADTEEVLEDPNDPCWKFTMGYREQMEFYSPMYPDNYPKNIDCIKIITGSVFLHNKSHI